MEELIELEIEELGETEDETLRLIELEIELDGLTLLEIDELIEREIEELIEDDGETDELTLPRLGELLIEDDIEEEIEEDMELEIDREIEELIEDEIELLILLEVEPVAVLLPKYIRNGIVYRPFLSRRYREYKVNPFFRACLIDKDKSYNISRHFGSAKCNLNQYCTGWINSR